MKKLLKKKVRVYSTAGLYREGILLSVQKDSIVIKGQNNKLVAFNLANVFAVEEQ